MDTPRSLDGEFVLREVNRRVVPRGGRVADCPFCGGTLFEDGWHVAATVARDSQVAPRPATFYLCGDDCLRAWLSLYD